MVYNVSMRLVRFSCDYKLNINKAMKQDIENIIKKNLPEKTDERKVATFGGWQAETYGEKMLVNAVLDQINTSLIADEVLKVVVETLRNNIDKIQKYTGGSSVEPKDIRVKLKDVLQLLSNLSPNKENKNNE